MTTLGPYPQTSNNLVFALVVVVFVVIVIVLKYNLVPMSLWADSMLRKFKHTRAKKQDNSRKKHTLNK